MVQSNHHSLWPHCDFNMLVCKFDKYETMEFKEKWFFDTSFEVGRSILKGITFSVMKQVTCDFKTNEWDLLTNRNRAKVYQRMRTPSL